MTRIEVFADVMCPFAHVGLRRLAEARRTRGTPGFARVRAWPLEWINGVPVAADVARQEIEALRSTVAPDLFAHFDPAAFPKTSLPAFGLAAAAYAAGGDTGERVSLAIRDALFEQGRDISDPRVVQEIGARFAVAPLDPRAAVSSVTDDWERGELMGVKGSPHFFVGDRDWFCPSLRVRHDDGGFHVAIADETMRDFYASAVG